MKDIYELLNDVNIDFNNVEEIYVDELERKKGKEKLMKSIKKRKTKRQKRFIAVASIVLVFTISGVIVKNPAWAVNIPIIGGIIQKTFVDSNPKFENYLNVIGQTNSCDGIDITFENAAADKNTLILSYVVRDNNKPIEDYVNVLSPMIVKVNGEEVNASGGADGEKIDDNTVRILQTIDLNFDKLPNKLDIEVLDEGQNMDIKFSMDTKEIENSTKTKTINRNFNIDSNEGNIKNIIVSPITTKVNYYVEQSEQRPICCFWIFDQDNNELEDEGGRVTTLGCDDYVEGRSDYSNNYVSRKDMSRLTFIPINYKYKGNHSVLASQKVDIDNFNPISFKITDNIVLVVENLDRDNDKIAIKYNYYYKNKKLLRVDGGNLFVKNGNISDEFIKPLDENVDTESNTIIYKIGDVKEIEIGCYDTLTNRILEDQAFSIDIK